MARILLYIAQMRVVRIFCGREIQATIEESVYTLLLDLINKFALAYRTTKAKISCLTSGSTFGFKGFRERGSVNIRGLEGVHIVWVDEAQALTKPTLDALIPTLRQDNVKFIFTLNRFMREDAVMELSSRPDCLHIHVNYDENPFCPVTLLDEAEQCRLRSQRDYEHIWLGQPMKLGDEYIFNSEHLEYSIKNTPYGDLFFKARILGIDIAAQGNDSNVATIIDRASAEHWKLTQQIKWDEPDTTITTGNIIRLIAEWKPNVIILDVGGIGWAVYNNLNAAKISNVYPFDGGSRKGIGPRSLNVRADGYWNLRDWFENKFICAGEGYRETLKQLERLKRKPRPDGLNQVREKREYKEDHGHSPDEADSLMMAVYGARYLGKTSNSAQSTEGSGVTRKSGLRRRI